MTTIDPPLWAPDENRIKQTRLYEFSKFLTKRGHGPFDDFASLHWFSVKKQEAFWDAIWDFTGVIGEKGDTIIERSKQLPKTRFFPEARLNFAENLLRPDSNPDDTLIIGANEEGVTIKLTRKRLAARVGHLQQLLKADGVTKGDVVAILLPNVAQAYVCMLAATGLGATVISTSPDFGADGVLDRFSQVEPKVLFATESYRYGGKVFDIRPKLKAIKAALGTLQSCYVVPTVNKTGLEINELDHGVWLSDALEAHDKLAPTFERLPFDHPLYVLFSSGTTGKPKPIVHRSGGVLLMHLKEHQLACDIRKGDRVYYFTTTGWMMWNWLASVIANEAAIVVYDGNPAYPSLTRQFSLADDVGVTLFGTSAKFIEVLMKADQKLNIRHDLSTIRTICSTGSPLSNEGFEYVYRDIKSDVHLASMSGGTDLCGCLVGGDPTGAVYVGQIQRPMLGMAIDVIESVGRSCAPGVQGELVCTKPFPSMPITFLGEDGDARYHSAYFERFDNIWHQGDFASWTGEGGIVIHGRSDATLNPSGVRIGTAELYAQVEKVDEVLESLVIGQNYASDVRIVLFVRLREGVQLDEALIAKIKSTIRAGATPRHVPAVVLEVKDLPRTRSGKIAEIAVRDVVHGRGVKNTAALANPEALEVFTGFAELKEPS